MRRSHTNFRFAISPSACILAAMMLLLLPLRWIICALIAAVFHEICHALAVYFCGGKIEELSVGDRGAVMRADALHPVKKLICVLAGPIGGLLLVLLVRWIPRIAFCALVQSAYNLLPIYPLDGGRALRCILPDRHCRVIQVVFLSAIWAFAVYLTVIQQLGIVPLIVALVLTQTKNSP